MKRDYTIGQIRLMHRAARENQQEEWRQQKELLQLQVLGIAAAIAQTLGGKDSKALPAWLDLVNREPAAKADGERPSGPTVSPAAQAFFDNSPVLPKP